MVEAHEAAGATRIFTTELWVDQPGHLLGTARMGDDPATSVVDSYGKDPRRRQPLHRRRQHLRHLRFGQPHLHDQRPGAAGRQEGRRKRLCTKGTVMTSFRSAARQPAIVGPIRDTRPPRALTEAELATLLRIADCLIPAAGPNPAASDAEEYLEYLRVGARRPRRRIRRGDVRASTTWPTSRGDELRARAEADVGRLTRRPSTRCRRSWPAPTS